MGQLIVSRPSKWGRLLTGVAAGAFVLTDLENFGSRNANAFEWSQLEIKTKTSGSSRETTSFKGQVSSSDWLNIRLDGTSLDLNRTLMDPFASYGFINSPEHVQKEKGTVTDSRVTLSFWDDWVRFISRQAVSSYIPLGADLANIRQTDAGVGLDNGATSQHIESNIWKTGSTRLALFAGYARAGASFLAPENVIKRDDLFSKPNSTTTRLGGTVEQGPVTLTLEQRDVQSLLQANAPTLVKNQIGVSLSLDQLLGHIGAPKGFSWVLPASAYFNVAQGKVSASLSQGVHGDTTFDVSAGLSWNIEKMHVNLGYWQSDYNSQLYPWKGSGINGSLGFYEGPWGIDFYFDFSRSTNGAQQLNSQTLDSNYVTSGVRFYSVF
jgi:hypothetical protein